MDEIKLTDLEAELMTRSMQGWRAVAQERAAMIRRADTMLREMQQDEQGLVQLVCVSHGVRMPKDWSITTDERGRAISIVPRVPSGQSTGGEAAKAEAIVTPGAE